MSDSPIPATTLSAHSTLAPNSASLRERDVVFALSERERNLFFPANTTDVRSGSGGIDGARWLTNAEMSRENWSQTLRAVRPACLVTCWSTPRIPEDWLREENCPLRYVCHVTGSVRQLIPRSFLEQGGLVTNWGAHVSPQVAEHALLLAMAALRNMGAWRSFIARPANARRTDETDGLGTRTLFGRKVGLHGFGNVARALIPLLRPFGVSICAYSAGVPAAVMHELDVQPCPSLKDLFSRSEILFECESLTPSTLHIVSADALAALPDRAVFVNVGRGALVDDAALLREAQTGRLCIALDVIESEPMTVDTTYYKIPGAILSPHIGGPTLDRYHEYGTMAWNNIKRFQQGAALDNIITLVAYDRST